MQTEDDRVLFTDWSDAAALHPFFDVAFFLAEIGARPAGCTRRYKDRLVQAYLSEWGELGSTEACAAAEDHRAAVHRCATTTIFCRAWRSRGEMENMQNYNLRLMLKACAEQA
ncbi:MAG: hypothetical protein IPK17_05160 [Chloroflexi bacterium]|uniref:hypothetical protein n=1 Tax=Candidatus Flexifilum breve TaxID=3140694 RepID=UPI003135AB5D|nr:hypothetical protein [Chloroflexota bacterium]